MSNSSPVPDNFIKIAHLLADKSEEIITHFYRKPFAVETKVDDTPVTIADREAERVMRDIITHDLPDHGLYGEEYGPERPESEWVWVLDPIDGTKAFITGKPSFGTLIALLHWGKPVLGLMNQPITKERWLGLLGQKTKLNDQEIGCRACSDLSYASLYATTPSMFIEKDLEIWDSLYPQAKVQRYGADCYAYGLLAAGFVDLVIEASLKPYDYLALVPIIEGAGGAITDWQGQTLTLLSDGHVLAAGDKILHKKLIPLLTRHG
jgi:inositol-phosphate phosphatase/L-galactose 1-phosphate phosphatase/histidinol-phosphatase